MIPGRRRRAPAAGLYRYVAGRPWRHAPRRPARGGLYYADGQIRRGLQYASFRQCEDVPPRRDLYGLPRPAQPEAPRIGQPLSRAMPRGPANYGTERAPLHPPAPRAPSASPATCPPLTYMSSIPGTTTRSAFHAPISRSATACRIPVPDATRTVRPSGRPDRCRLGTAIPRAAFSATPGRSALRR